MTDVLDLKLADFGNAAYIADAAESYRVYSNRSASPLQPSSEDRPEPPCSRDPIMASSTPSPESSPTKSASSAGSSVIDGIGRGTQPYSAPELFARVGMYSFPVRKLSIVLPITWRVQSVMLTVQRQL